jgi:signal peptidase I
MKDMHFGDYVWFEGQGYQYIGMDSDGTIQLCRPEIGNPFDIIEFEQVYPEDVDQFFTDNGESLREKMVRK